jgi:hypothetical protein
MMATEFEDAFNEDPQAAPEQNEDQAFGLVPNDTPAAAAADSGETATVPEGEPAAVVVVEEAGEGDGSAVANAAAANEEANANAGQGDPVTTGEQEAAAAGGETAAAAPAVEDAPHGEMPVGGDEVDEPTDPKEIQRKKSWEGRLKAEEKRLKDLAAQLEAKAAGTGQTEEGAAADAVTEAAEEAAQSGDTAMADAAQEVAAKIDSGEIDVDAGLAQLAEDFGEPFVKLMQAIARREAAAVADERVGKVAKDVEDVVGHLKTNAERAHFQAIYDKHPDFVQVAEDPAFKEFAASQGAEAVVEAGSASEINDLLTQFKDSRQAAPAAEELPAADAAPAAADEGASPAQDAVAAAAEAAPDPALEEAADAAEGVRSAGLRIPERPAPADKDDFKAAWEQF